MRRRDKGNPTRNDLDPNRFFPNAAVGYDDSWANARKAPIPGEKTRVRLRRQEELQDELRKMREVDYFAELNKHIYQEVYEGKAPPVWVRGHDEYQRRRQEAELSLHIKKEVLEGTAPPAWVLIHEKYKEIKSQLEAAKLD